MSILLDLNFLRVTAAGFGTVPLLDYGDIAWVVFCLIAILFGVYYFTRFFARRSGYMAKGRYLSRVESIAIGKEQYLHIIRAGNKILVISSGANGARLITTLKPEELRVPLEDTAPNEDSPVAEALNRNPIYKATRMAKDKFSRNKHNKEDSFADMLDKASGGAPEDGGEPSAAAVRDDGDSIGEMWRNIENRNKYYKYKNTKGREEP